MRKPHLYRIGAYWHCDNTIVMGTGLCPVSAYMSMLAHWGRHQMQGVSLPWDEHHTVPRLSSGMIVRQMNLKPGYPHLP